MQGGENVGGESDMIGGENVWGENDGGRDVLFPV